MGLFFGGGGGPGSPGTPWDRLIPEIDNARANAPQLLGGGGGGD